MACTSADVRGLTPVGLVTYLKTTNWDCFNSFLWSLSPDVEGVLSDAHLIAVFEEVAAQAPSYTGDDQQHLYELLLFAHAAYVHKGQQPENPRLFSIATVEPTALAALNGLQTNSHFHDLTEWAAFIAYEWVNIVDNAFLANVFYGRFIVILQLFNADPARQRTPFQNFPVDGVLYAVYRQADFYALFQAVITQSLLTELRTLSLNTSVDEQLPSRAVWALGAICRNVPRWKTAAVQAMTDARAAWPRLSGPWLWTVDALDRCNGCLDATGARLCKSEVIQQLIFPNTFTFDDGALIVHTSLALAEVQFLYHAMKEVEAQFSRLTQTIAPLPGDPTDTLTVALFKDQDAYRKLSPFLYNYSPGGEGGIYLESIQTLLTFERPSSNTYTLEELVRHEYAHYLVGRFVIQGMWGSTTPIYQNGRMVWFDEGLAEFLTGSTLRSGIRPRRNLVDLVSQHGLNRMPVAAVLHAGYGDDRFYSYAGLLFAYWYERDIGTLLDLIELVRTNNIEGFDLTVGALEVDANLQTEYDQYLVTLINSISTLTDPQTTVPPLQSLALTTTSEVQTRVRRTRIGYQADANIAAVEANTRFCARGTLSGPLGTQRNLVAAWRLFNDNLDELLQDLAGQRSNNFGATTARFGRIRWVDYGGGQSYPMADYYVEGPLPHRAQLLLPPVQQVTEDFRSTRLGINAQAIAIGPKRVQATLSLTTTVVPATTSRVTLLNALEDARDELRNQVYAIRPPYYRSLEVSWDGPMQIIPFSNGQRYGLRNVVCTIDFV